MALKIQDFIDVEQFQMLQDRLNEIYSFPSAIIDNDGTVLTATAWQDVCTKFHRQHSECAKECVKSDQYILSHLHEANPAVSYRCPHGLIDNATPIIIEGVHYGNFFTGQFFLEPPDLDFFRAQAKKYGFAEEAYLEAVKKVPIWTQEKLNSYLFFIKGLIEVISGIGLKNLKEIETRERIRESEERFRAILQTAMDGFWLVDMQGRLLEVNETYCRMSGYDKQELLALRIFDLEAAETEDKTTAHIRKVVTLGEDRFESRHRRKDGRIFDVEVSVQYRPAEGGRLVAFLRNITDSKRAQAALREGEEIFRRFMEYSPIYVFFKDENSRALQLSKNYEKMLGKPLAELLGKSMDDLFPSEFAKRMIADDMRILQEGKDITVEEEFNDRFYSTTKFPIVIDGKPRFLAGYTIDITDRKRAEEALRESEERFRKIFEEAHLGIVITSPSFAFEKPNPAFCRMMGYSADELRSMTFLDITYPDHLQQDIEKVKEVGQGKIPFYQTEKRYITKSGDVLWGNLIVSSIRDELGALRYYLSMVIDITERKQAEEKLGRLKQQEELILSSAAEGILGLDLRGNHIFVNPATARMLGYEVEELLGSPSHSVWHHTKPDGIPYPKEECKILAVCRDKVVHRVSTEVFWRKDGTSFPVEYAATPIYVQDRVEGVVVTFTDITARTQAEEEKRSLQERLQRAEKMEAIGQLAGGVAHDLNNVLGVSTVYSELLRDKIPEGNPLRAYATNILGSNEKAAAIIQDLLTLARRGVAVSEVINLNSVVADFVRAPVFEKIRAFHPNVTFRTEYDGQLMNIKGSPVHMEKTVMNLVSNAAEAIHGKGEVTIRTQNLYIDTPIRGYDHVEEGDYAVLAVSDTGTGIPVENREKIFEPFYTKKTMGRSGTGLGLAIVWGTVKDHKGYIDLQSEVGKGTTFTLYFPVTREEPIIQQQKTPVERYMGKGESVLVVDDVADQRDVAASLLTRLGYQVHAASSGEEAVEYLKEHKADIVVLDMIMTPGIDGLETYKRILEVNPMQKAILVSGFSETDRVKAALELGAGAYVRKPYLMERIGVAIRDELNR